MRFLLAGVVSLLLSYGFSASKPPCTISVTPSISISPLRFLHVTTHLDDPTHWWLATIFIVDADGEIDRHQLFEGDMALHEPKTRTTDYNSIFLVAGEYEVQLVAATREGERCVAKQHLEVQSDGQTTLR